MKKGILLVKAITFKGAEEVGADTLITAERKESTIGTNVIFITSANARKKIAWNSICTSGQDLNNRRDNTKKDQEKGTNTTEEIIRMRQIISN